MPVHESSKATVSAKRKTFQCTNKEDFYISGNYNSNAARLIRIKLTKCVDKPYCKPEKEIKDFFSGLYLLTLNN